jgi:outer membrane protein assembly factor BamB
VIALTAPYPGSPDGSISRIDVRTGRSIWTTRAGYFRSSPSLCSDDDAVVCATGRLDARGGAGELRFALATGKQQLPSAAGSTSATTSTTTTESSAARLRALVLTDNARSLADGLVDPGRRSPELLAGMRGAAVAWYEPIAPIFGPRATSDWGWTFERYDGLGLFVGTEYPTPPSQTATEVTFDYSDAVTAAFSIGTGKVAWRDHGSKFECGWLPCPRQPLIGLRLRVRGTLVHRLEGTPITLSPDFDTTLEAFSLATGKTAWHYDLGHTATLVWASPAPPQTSADRLVLPAADGGYDELDLATGAHHRVARSVTAWCRQTIEYRQAEGWSSDGHMQYDYDGQDSLYACNATGKRIDPPARVPSYVASIGANARGMVAWSDSHLLIGVPA